MKRDATILVLGLGVLFALRCGGDDSGSGTPTGTTGASGSSATSGAAGSTASTSGSGGASTGSSGAAGASTGSSGAAGAAGSGGSGGSGGAGGSSGGSGGSGGAAGSGGAKDGGPGGSSGAAGSAGARDGGASDAASTMMSFFVTSTGSGASGGNLGGLDGADMKCRMLATAVGAGAKTWRAFLSVAMGPGGTPVHAKDRIGTGPWYDSRGRLIAMNLTDLLPGPNLRPVGDMAAVNDMLDEKGAIVQKSPLQHDILTGTKADGTLATGLTCGDWMDGTTATSAQLGHADLMGPADRHSWVESHTTTGCTTAAVAAGGGNGRIYCFATN